MTNKGDFLRLSLGGEVSGSCTSFSTKTCSSTTTGIASYPDHLGPERVLWVVISFVSLAYKVALLSTMGEVKFGVGAFVTSRLFIHEK